MNADGSVTVAWETAAEVANAGFNVYRSVSADALGEMGERCVDCRVQRRLVPVRRTTSRTVAVGAGIFRTGRSGWRRMATFAHGPVEAVTPAPTSAGVPALVVAAALPLVLVSLHLAVALLGGVFVSRRKA